MRRMISAVLAVALSIGVTLGVVGCNINTEQAKVVAQNAGLFAAVGWVAVDNPSTNVTTIVSGVLDVIVAKASEVTGGATYTEVLYPEIDAFLSGGTVADQYKPLCRAGSIALLGGIDMLFAANPTWKQNQEIAIQVVTAFANGAKNGLAMSGKDPVVQAAKKMHEARVKVLKK